MTANIVPLFTSEPELLLTNLHPSERGFSVLYRGAATACPGCGRSSWIVGRLSAECAFVRCGTAIALEGVRL